MIELSREQQAVLACARHPMDAGSVTLEGLDWEEFFHAAQSLGVIALVAANLAAHFRGKLTAPVAERLQRLRQAALAVSARTAARTAEVAGWFAAEGIETLILKGAPLAALLYESPLLRHSSDIDVMAHPCDVGRAWRMLTARRLRPSFDLDERQVAALIRVGYAHDFHAPGNRMLVDLHWDVQPHLCPLDISKVWTRAQDVAVENRVYRTLSKEDYLLFLCYHPVKHTYRSLRAVCDIAALLRQELDWDYVQREAEAAGCCRMLRLGVGLAQTLLGASSPMRNEPGIERLMQVACAGLFGPHRAFRDSPTAWGLRVLDTPRQKAAFLAHKVFVPNEDDFALLSLTEGMFVCYYGLRCIRLPWRYAGIVKRLLQRKQKSPV